MGVACRTHGRDEKCTRKCTVNSRSSGGGLTDLRINRSKKRIHIKKCSVVFVLIFVKRRSQPRKRRH
jgi:hypothetical protein